MTKISPIFSGSIFVYCFFYVVDVLCVDFFLLMSPEMSKSPQIKLITKYSNCLYCIRVVKDNDGNKSFNEWFWCVFAFWHVIAPKLPSHWTLRCFWIAANVCNFKRNSFFFHKNFLFLTNWKKMVVCSSSYEFTTSTDVWKWTDCRNAMGD